MSTSMITLTPDEVTLIKTILTALRGIKVRDIDKVLNVNYFGGSRQLFWRIEALQIAAGVM